MVKGSTARQLREVLQFLAVEAFKTQLDKTLVWSEFVLTLLLGEGGWARDLLRSLSTLIMILR